VRLLVGLGNPGKKYHGTRHNIGFDVLEVLAARAGNPARRQRFQGEYCQVSLGGFPAMLLWPLTWMNLSGGSVRAVRDFYKLEHPGILVICDDFQLPLGTIRLRSRGSAGGQKGLADILRQLGDQAIPRLRVGIGPVPAGRDPADFVLARFSAADRPDADAAIGRAADAAEAWLASGIEQAMNRYN